MKKGFLLDRVEKCSHTSENGRCHRPKSTGLTKEENPKGLCKYHFETLKSEETFNETCAICMENIETKESGKMFLLSCMHRFHTKCLSGLVKEECPICRSVPLNLPKSIKKNIKENSSKYKREQNEQEERDFREMMENEGLHLQPVRLPPQIEVMLALKYVVQLGIPVSLIPRETVLELDPQSPLPEPGSIFQNTVRHLINTIQRRTNIVEEDDEYITREDEEIILDDDDENPFVLVGENLQIIHCVRTVPTRSGERHTIREVSSLFSTMNFQIADLPDITQEDLINLRMGRRFSEEN